MGVLTRSCEDCGTKMAPFQRRSRREDGLLVCDACASGRPGGGRVEAKREAGGPAGHWCRFCNEYQSTRTPAQARKAKEHHRAHIEAGDEPLPPEEHVSNPASWRASARHAELGEDVRVCSDCGLTLVRGLGDEWIHAGTKRPECPALGWTGSRRAASGDFEDGWTAGYRAAREGRSEPDHWRVPRDYLIGFTEGWERYQHEQGHPEDAPVWMSRVKRASRRQGSRRHALGTAAAVGGPLDPELDSSYDPYSPVHQERCRSCGEPIALAEGGSHYFHVYRRPGDPARDHTPLPERYAKRVAHQSQDAVIRHCPFCGSGQVIARSDASVVCDYCSRTFTVSLQPTFPEMPQSVGDENEEELPFEEVDPNEAPPALGETPLDDDEVEEDEVDETDDDDLPAFLTSSLERTSRVFYSGSLERVVATNGHRRYRTSTGAMLSEEDYLRHLALRHAEDRDATLRRVRASRGEA